MTIPSGPETCITDTEMAIPSGPETCITYTEIT
jgi:hypothetical protein